MVIFVKFDYTYFIAKIYSLLELLLKNSKFFLKNFLRFGNTPPLAGLAIDIIILINKRLEGNRGFPDGYNRKKHFVFVVPII